MSSRLAPPLTVMTFAAALAACGSGAPDLPLTQGPQGASGHVTADLRRIDLTLDGSRCTGRPMAERSDTGTQTRHIAILTCKDGRSGTVTLSRLSRPALTYEGLLELERPDRENPGQASRLIFGPSPDAP